MNEWMTAWMNEWTNERMNEWLNEWINEMKWNELKWNEMNAWMHECMNAWMNEWMDEWMDGWMNEWTNERTNEWMSEWVNGWMSEWLNEWVVVGRFFKRKWCQMTFPLFLQCLWWVFALFSRDRRPTLDTNHLTKDFIIYKYIRIYIIMFETQCQFIITTSIWGLLESPPHKNGDDLELVWNWLLLPHVGQSMLLPYIIGEPRSINRLF